MIPLLYLSAFAAALFFVLAFSDIFFAGRVQVKDRLERVKHLDEAETDPLQLPFSQRVLLPLIESLQERILQFAPAELRRTLEKMILYAGRPWNLNFNLLTAFQMALAIVLPLSVFALFQTRAAAAPPGVGFYLALFLGGFLLPLALVKIKADRRQDEIRKAMPEMLDLLLVSVEAGQGFDQALKHVVEKLPGELSREMQRFLEEVRMGRPRVEALWSLAERTGVPELRLFVTSVIQAEQRWGNIAGAVGAQADLLRRKRRKWAEEAARKAPVKMLFPLIFFIFPALLVVLLGPALFMLIKAFAEIGR